MKLFRPVGEREFHLIQQSGFKRFPPRLAGQPVFYPALNKKYATEIASKWNTADRSSGYKGYMLEFEVEDSYISWFEVKNVSAGYREELWIPAEQMEEFNSHIKGLISVVGIFEMPPQQRKDVQGSPDRSLLH